MGNRTIQIISHFHRNSEMAPAGHSHKNRNTDLNEKTLTPNFQDRNDSIAQASRTPAFQLHMTLRSVGVVLITHPFNFEPIRSCLRSSVHQPVQCDVAGWDCTKNTNYFSNKTSCYVKCFGLSKNIVLLWGSFTTIYDDMNKIFI
jgi:hypothetical protein